MKIKEVREENVKAKLEENQENDSLGKGASKFDNLSLSPRTCMLAGKNSFSQVVT